MSNALNYNGHGLSVRGSSLRFNEPPVSEAQYKVIMDTGYPEVSYEERMRPKQSSINWSSVPVNLLNKRREDEK